MMIEINLNIQVLQQQQAVNLNLANQLSPQLTSNLNKFIRYLILIISNPQIGIRLMATVAHSDNLINQKISDILHQITLNFKINDQRQEGSVLSTTEEEKLTISILFKISTYFIELTELCISKMQAEQIKEIRKRLLANKQTIQGLFSRNEQSKKRLLEQKNKPEFQKIATHEQIPFQLLQSMRLNKPKHPVSSFFFFFKEKSKQIAITSGQKIGSKIAKLVADIWKSMSEVEKEPYEALAKQTRSKYDEDMKVFKNEYATQLAYLKKIKKNLQKQRKQSKFKSLEQDKTQNSKLSLEGQCKSQDESESDILSDSLSSHSNEALKDIAAKKGGSIMRLENKPKAPVSSFFIYYRQNGKQLSEIHNLPQGPKMIKVASEIWNNMTEEEKRPYNALAQKTRKRYYEEMNRFKLENAQELRQFKKLKQQMKKMQKKQ